jgi:branched-chain amino acid transport system ATP-binding protein
MADLLRIDELTAGYEGTVVLERVSLTLGAQSSMALLGRNGVGKSTLLATIMGLTQVVSGRVELNGKDITGLETHRRAAAGIGLVPQEREIFPSLTLEENLIVASRPGHWNRDLVFELFPRLAERRRNLGGQLSGGEQQMLAVGRALVGNPVLLLLDEPFEGLAPVIVEQLAAAFDRIRREFRVATILVEHHAELALELTEHAIVLDRGQVAWSGDAAILRGDADKLAMLIGLDEGTASVPDGADAPAAE